MLFFLGAPVGCYVSWAYEHGLLPWSALANAVTGTSYYLIPLLMLEAFRLGSPVIGIGPKYSWAFRIFITACGTGHFFADVLGPWYPAVYPLRFAADVTTALVSAGTVYILLVHVRPRFRRIEADPVMRRHWQDILDELEMLKRKGNVDA